VLCMPTLQLSYPMKFFVVGTLSSKTSIESKDHRVPPHVISGHNGERGSIRRVSSIPPGRNTRFPSLASTQ